MNFEEVSDDNISIGETQRELIIVFEIALAKITDNKFSKQVQDFYSTEKDALEKIIETISTEIVYAPPYFAKQHNLQDTILTHLATEFEKEKDITILQIGLKYVKTNKPSIFEHYENAQNFITSCINAIKQKSIINLKNQNNNTNKTALNKFSNFQKSFEEQVIRAFDGITEQENENKNIISLFEESINISQLRNN